MSPRIMFAALLAGIAAFAADTTTAAACDHCGCAAPCQKVCRLICEKKKVEITCWGCKCEDFCIPGPSKPGCKHCEIVCENCDEKDDKGICSQSKKFVWTEWCPGCAKIHSRKKLMKKTITKEIPSYKWKVEELCHNCCAQTQSVMVPAGTEIPQVPTGLGRAASILPVGFLAPESPTRYTAEDSDEFEPDGSVRPAAFHLPALPSTNAVLAPARKLGDSLRFPWQR